MTKEVRFKNLLDGYRSRIDDIDNTYRERISNALTAEETLEINAWHIQETNKADNDLWADTLNLMQRKEA